MQGGNDPSSDAAAKEEAAVAEPVTTPPKNETSRKLSCYGTLTTEEQKIVDEEHVVYSYDIHAITTWRVFGILNGTVLVSRTLWMETAMTALLYWVFFGALYSIRWKNFSEFVGKEAAIRAFISMFSTLIGLLLSFYTSLNLGRWWQMRCSVQHIQEGCKKLTMMLSQGVTDDQELLDTIHRYARASLFLVFAASQCDEESPRVMAVKAGLLTQEEADNLEQCNPHKAFVHAETLWVWLANVVTRLHDQGLTKGPPHYCALMSAVEEGRSGVAEIQCYLETPIPLGYVHLLCLMVKLHNVILSILMAMASVMLAGGDKGFQAVGVFRTAFRAFFMPFLYNAILMLNAEVVNPFGSDAADFEYKNFDMNMLMNGKAHMKAGSKLPKALARKDFKPFKPGSV